MRKTVIGLLMCVALLVLGGTHSLRAQDLLTPPPTFLPPPPPPPPPPKIEVPKVPQLGEIPNAPKAALPKRGSFDRRMTRCIEQGAAMGLGPNERAAYSRECANR